MHNQINKVILSEILYEDDNIFLVKIKSKLGIIPNSNDRLVDYTNNTIFVIKGRIVFIESKSLVENLGANNEETSLCEIINDGIIPTIGDLFLVRTIPTAR